MAVIVGARLSIKMFAIVGTDALVSFSKLNVDSGSGSK